LKYWNFINSLFTYVFYKIFACGTISNSRLGVSYNVFDGTETLEQSVRSIRPYAEYISVVLQVTSNYGEKISEFDMGTIQELKVKNLIDEIVIYQPEIFEDKLQGTLNEINKRQLGFNLSVENGCDVHMSIDTDEIYEPDQLHYALWRFNTSNYTTAICNHRQYVLNSSWELAKPEGGFVTLFEKIRDGKYDIAAKLPFPVDPTRVIKSKRNKILRFYRFEVEMHHLTMVRRDILKKYRNSSAGVSHIDAAKVKNDLQDLSTTSASDFSITWPDGSVRKIQRVRNHKIPFVSS
jgi:hypothetical protein